MLARQSAQLLTTTPPKNRPQNLFFQWEFLGFRVWGRSVNTCSSPGSFFKDVTFDTVSTHHYQQPFGTGTRNWCSKSWRENVPFEKQENWRTRWFGGPPRKQLLCLPWQSPGHNLQHRGKKPRQNCSSKRQKADFWTIQKMSKGAHCALCSRRG